MTHDKRRRDIQRLGAMPTGLAEYSTATLSDAFEKMGLKGQVLEPAIRPVLPFTKMVGTAVTVKVEAAERPSSCADLVGQAFEAGRQVVSPVLVIEQPQELLGATVIGSGGAHVMRNQYGFAGCLIDGLIRDTDDLRKMNFQIFCRGCHPTHTYGCLRGVSVNQRVRVGGIDIQPGDILVGDNDGIVVIPPDSLDQVLAAADETLAQERQVLREIDSGTPYLEVVRRHQPEAFQGEEGGAS
jgi:4-hydroxy-4-methyl-2-oxoglutarate aldolase